MAQNNFYVDIKSFQQSNLKVLIKNLIELNEVVFKVANVDEDIFWNENFSCILTEAFYSGIPMADICKDQYFARNLNGLFNRVRQCEIGFENPIHMDDYFNHSRNAFWGIYSTKPSSRHLNNLNDFLAFKKVLLEQVLASENIWDNRQLYSNLIFADSLEEAFKDCQQANTKLRELLSKLDKYCNEDWEKGKPFIWNHLRAMVGVAFTDESRTVKTNPKKANERIFKINNKIGYIQTFNHAHIGDFRLYIHPMETEHKICIASLTSHLSTKKF